MGDEDVRIASSLGVSAAAAGSLSLVPVPCVRVDARPRLFGHRARREEVIENARTLALCVLAARVGRVSDI